jgi:hypothetical protein
LAELFTKVSEGTFDAGTLITLSSVSAISTTLLTFGGVSIVYCFSLAVSLGSKAFLSGY